MIQLRRQAAVVLAAAAAFTLAACGLGPSSAAGAHRSYLIGFLSGDALPPVLVDTLKDLGYIEGQNVRFEARPPKAGGKAAYGPYAAELVALKSDVIVTGGQAPTEAAKQATSTIPVVFHHASDPVGSGLVATLAHPGGNLTGFTTAREKAAVKYLGLSRRLVPDLRHVGVLWSPAKAPTLLQLHRIQDAASAIGVDVRGIEFNGVTDLQPAFQTAAAANLSTLIVSSSDLTSSDAAIEKLAALAVEFHMPTVGDAGAIIAFRANNDDFWRGTGEYVARILRGAKAADLPVQEPIVYDLVVDLRLARAMGLTVPPDLLDEATDALQ